MQDGFNLYSIGAAGGILTSGARRAIDRQRNQAFHALRAAPAYKPRAVRDSVAAGGRADCRPGGTGPLVA